MTPTTVAHESPPSRLRRRPSGSCPGQKRFAATWFTTTTGDTVSRSASVYRRPRTSGMPSVRKKSGLAVCVSARGPTSFDDVGAPSITTDWLKNGTFWSGRTLATATDCTPGSLRSRSSSGSVNARIRSPLL